MQIAEILKALDLAPSEMKLAALGELNVNTDPAILEQVRGHLDEIVLKGQQKTSLRFYAARALVVLGDRREAVIEAVESFLGEQIFEDREKKLIWFPWVPQDLASSEELLNFTSRLRCNVSYSVVETLSRLRDSERATLFVRKLLDGTENTEIRVLSLYALGAIGNDSSRPTLEYYRTSLEKKPEGKAAAAALQGFGVVSLFDLIGTEKKASCFVVTAVSGSPTSLEVQVCRAFRDNVLQNFGAGRAFIERYYRVGPKLATFIASRPWLRRVIRLLLVQPVVALLIRLGFPRADPCGLDRR